MKIDPNKYGLWLCARKSYFPFTNHVYLWDDQTGTAYEMSSAFGFGYGKTSRRDAAQFNPRYGHKATFLCSADSPVRKQILHDITQNAHNKFFVPWINDCFTLIEEKLEKYGFDSSLVHKIASRVRLSFLFE